MNTVVHPGEMLREECLKPLKMTVSSAARHLGVSRKALSELVNGENSLSMEMAVRLTQAFGGDVAMWMGLQLNYDLANVERYKAIKIPRVTAPDEAAYA